MLTEEEAIDAFIGAFAVIDASPEDRLLAAYQKH